MLDSARCRNIVDGIICRRFVRGRRRPGTVSPRMSRRNGGVRPNSFTETPLFVNDVVVIAALRIYVPSRDDGRRLAADSDNPFGHESFPIFFDLDVRAVFWSFAVSNPVQSPLCSEQSTSLPTSTPSFVLRDAAFF